MNNIAIFASGSGSNAEQIIKHFKDSKTTKVELILCNKPDAFVLQRAENHNIKSITFTKNELCQSSKVIDALTEHKIDYIVLAGFLLLMPANIVEKYNTKIINIHPALLPKFGGKGMYGENVHRAVIEAKESTSGITIHHVNQHFDEGDTIFQAEVAVCKEDTAETLAQKIHQLEHKYFPSIIEQQLEKL